MNYVEYKDEEVREEIFEGSYILDGLRLTEEQQRQKIFDLMRQAGIEIEDESKLEIGYEGADDDYGISETQSTKFVVTRRMTKKVPYKVTKEEVFEGTFILDGLRLTEEEQKDKIYDLMVRAGVSISKEEFDTYEIGYEGADDDYGISETQSTKFVVYKVTKERIDTSDIVSSKDDLSQVLEEIKALREKLNLIVNDVSKVDIIQELVDKTEGLEKMVSNNEKANSNVYTEAIKEIDQELIRVEKILKDAIKAYEESFEKMRSLLEEQNERLNNSGLLSDEEYNELMREFLEKKIEENERTIAIKKEIETIKKQISNLKKRKNKIKKDLMSAEALGISASQYQNITNTLMKRKIVNAIFEAKGLEEIIAIPYKERTKEQQEKLKEAKEQIIEEIAKLQKENEGLSVLDAIEALYGVDIEMIMKGKVKEYKVTKEELQNIKDNVQLLPEKVVGKENKLINNNVLNTINPTDAPEDMLEVYDKKAQEVVQEITEKEDNNLNVEEKEEENTAENEPIEPKTVEKETVEPEKVEKEEKQETTLEVSEKPIEIIKLFIDEKTLDVYARKYVFERFHLEKQSKEVIIDGSVCYKLDEEDADYIIENKDNNYSPYLIETLQLDIEKEIEESAKQPIEKITLYVDVDNNNEIYGNRYLFSRFIMDILSDEIRIDGKACFRMSEDDAAFILGNQDNSYSPYVVDTRRIQLGKREEIKEEEYDEKPIEKITFYIDTDNNNEVYGNRYLFSRFNMDMLSREVRIDGKVCFRMDEDDAAFILENKNNNYSPYIVEIREVHLGKRDFNSNNKQFEKKMEENTNSIKREKDENLQNEELKNDVKKEINTDIENENSKLDLHEEKLDSQEEKSGLPVEVITIYKDLDNDGYVYGNKDLFDRFNLDYSEDQVRIDGSICYRIEDGDLKFILGNQKNNYAPYAIDVRGVKLGKREAKQEKPKENLDNNYPVEKFSFYRDLNNGGVVYAKKYIFDRFNLDYIGEGLRIDGALCYQLDFDDADYILGNQNNNYSPYKVEIIDTQLRKKNEDTIENIDNIIINSSLNEEEKEEYDDNDFLSKTIINQPPIVEDIDLEKDINDIEKEDVVSNEEDEKDELVEEDKQEKLTAEDILASLTRGLDIGPKDCERYAASNIHVNENFKKELNTGNVSYNVVHYVPGILKTGIDLIRKLSAKLLLSARGKKAMMQLEDRLEQLSEEELEILFEEYKNIKLKTNMNNQINPIIIDRLRRYGLEKVAVLNDNIKENYTELFILLGQIKVLEEKLELNNLIEDEVSVFKTEKDKLMKQASVCAIRIKEDRVKANDLLSGGVYGLEEDFKAVASKLNYIGFRFAKTNAFDNELQHKLGQYGQVLNVAIANNDYEGIVNNFMNLESLYFSNNELKGNDNLGNGVGNKYFNAISEQFGYRNDVFVKDLLNATAVSSAIVNEANSACIYKVEKGINAHEKIELDMSDWAFNDTYHNTDRNGRGFFNKFNEDVTSSINNLVSKYTRGAITQDVALREIANIDEDSKTILLNVVRECLLKLQKYASTHPEYDYTKVEEAIKHLVEHPEIITNINVDDDLEHSIKGLTEEQFNSLVSIPSKMLSTLVCACGAKNLVNNVSYVMSKAYNDNLVEEDLDLFLEDEDLQEENSNHKTR